jgi:hypothetical protein
MLSTSIRQTKFAISLKNRSLTSFAGIKSTQKVSIPASSVTIVVPGIVGISRNDVRGKNSIKILTYFLTKVFPSVDVGVDN